MGQSLPYATLADLLTDHLEAKTAKEILSQLHRAGISGSAWELFEELGGISSKIQGEAVRGLGALLRGKGLLYAVPWLDVGITLSQATGALGLRYFKESPAILHFLESDSACGEMLHQVMEMADGSEETAAHCAYEWFKVLPQLRLEIPFAECTSWAALGMELAEWNYVLGNELFRELPNIVRAIPLKQAQAWIGFGMKLVVENKFGKPDYLGTLEFFRTSPQLFEEVVDGDSQRGVIDLGSNLADHSPELAISFLAEVPEILKKLPTEEWRVRVLQYGMLVADRDAEATVAYVKRAPEVVALTDPQAESSPFDHWFAQGMEALEYSQEAGRAFFGLETHQACAAIEDAMSGVPLRHMSRSLKMFARALCGEDIEIKSSAEWNANQQNMPTPSDETLGNRALYSREEHAIYLPMIMKRASTREGNQRWYTVMVAHETAHVEFGTYRISTEFLRTLLLGIQARYGNSSSKKEDHGISLGAVFQCYPQPRFIQDLWEIIEDARVEYRLQTEYEGLKGDLQTLRKEAIHLRSFSHGMTAREIVLDALLLYFSGMTKDDFQRPGLQEVIDSAWNMAKEILHPDAIVEDSMTLADRIYQELEKRIGQYEEQPEELEHFPNTEMESGSPASHEASERMETEYHHVPNLDYRGFMDPFQVQGESGASDTKETMGGSARTHKGEEGFGETEAKNQGNRRASHASSDSQGSPAHQFGESPMQTWFEPPMSSRGTQQGKRLGQGEFLYPEWDGILRDYRPHWCRVVEQYGKEGPPEFVDDTFHTYGPIIRLIRRYFETMRPEAFRRLGRQSDGEEIDIDALVEWMVDRRGGNDSTDRIYATRHKQDRQVAVSFVVDMSGSTSRKIGSRARPVIDIEKEGLLLLSEALGAVGDQFAMFGFSGQSRNAVEVYVLKDFQDRAGGRLGLKISGIQSHKQNRDGAVIRHATTRLLQQATKVRVLILISDGKPLDDDYGDEYSLEDTKMALREARQKGIHPFCVTIDQAPTDYVKRMYGDVSYLVVDDVEALPTRLPNIYRRLTTR